MNKLFDNIYVINLNKNINKKNLIHFKLKTQHINYCLFNAIDGQSLEISNTLNTISNGALGLINTYIKLLQHALDSNYKNILVLEDDCCFVNQINEKIHEYKKYFTFSKYNVIYLGANQITFSDEQRRKTLLNKPYDVSSKQHCITFGTYAISFNQNFYKMLLNYLKNLECFTGGIDVIIYNLIVNNNIRSKIIYPFLVMPDVTHSDIISNRNQKLFCLPRKYNINLYNYLSIQDYDIVIDYINKNNISLRTFFWSVYNSEVLFEAFTNYISNYFEDQDFLKSITKCILFVQGAYNNCNIKTIINGLFLLTEGCSHKFVCVIPSYNNVLNYKLNLKSFVKQNYPTHLARAIYIDDCSNDDTYNIVYSYLSEQRLSNRISLYRNYKRLYQGSSRYNSFHLTYDDEIIVLLDGDDWLASLEVFNILSNKYNKLNLLVSYGSYYVYDFNGENKIIDCTNIQGCRQFPKNVIINSDYRNYDWISCHLRTGYAKLFKKIKLDSLLSDSGLFYQMCTDRAEMIPILEMANDRHYNVMTGLCVYNKVNSTLYNQSYFNNNCNAIRRNIIREINSRSKYKKCIIDTEQLLINSFINVETLSTFENCSLYEINLQNVKYFIYKKQDLDLLELQNLLNLVKQTKSLLATTKQLSINKFIESTNLNYLNFSNKYIATRLKNITCELEMIPGIYNYKLLKTLNTTSNFTIICC